MGISKSDSFTAAQNQTAALFKALAHPARVAIIEHLIHSKECICNDFVKELPLAQPTISQHLKELRSSGLIQGTVSGNMVCYCLNPSAIELLKHYFSDIHHKLGSCKTTPCHK